MEKYQRYLKVSEYSAYSYKTPAPYIRMIGRWLEKAGFGIGDYIVVDIEDGKLVITKDDNGNVRKVREETKKLEREKKRLEERL